VCLVCIYAASKTADAFVREGEDRKVSQTRTLVSAFVSDYVTVTPQKRVNLRDAAGAVVEVFP